MTDRVSLQNVEATGSAGNTLTRTASSPGASWTNVGVTQSAYKAADEDVSNSDVLQNDDALVVNVEAGATYALLAAIFANLAVNSGIKFTLGGTCTVTEMKVEARIIDNLGVREETRMVALGDLLDHGASGTGDHFVEMHGAIKIANAGTLLVKWAQHTATLGNATVQKCSTLRATRTA